MTLSEPGSRGPVASWCPAEHFQEADTAVTPRRTVADPTVPATPPRPTRLYTISEVAARCGLSTHTLRWYERIGLMPHVDRSHTGQRRFTDRDLAWLEFVGKLRATGMPVSDMVRYAELVRAGDHTSAERLEMLSITRQATRRRIDELNEALATLDYKIDIYSDACRRQDQESTP